MKTSMLFLICLLPAIARAEVHALFPNDDATLIVQGTDSDAIALFESMNVEPSINNGLLTKQISYETPGGRTVFDLSCKKSPQTGSASCTLKFFSPEAVINKKQKNVLMGINDQLDAPMVARMFNHKTIDSYRAEVFQSLDNKLHIWKTLNSSGDFASFTMTYN